MNFGWARETLVRRLRENGVKVEAYEDIDAADILKAICGDKDAAMTRKLNADADSKERDNRKKAGELFELPAIEKMIWTDYMQPLRLDLEQMPKIYSGLCNPQEPEVAEKVLTQFVERLKLKIKEKQ